MSVKPIKAALLAATALACTVSFANAADLGRYEGVSMKDAVYAPPFSWTGMYVGVSGGYAWGDSTATDLRQRRYGHEFSTEAEGAVVGGTIGYNRQIGSLVVGVEGDIGWLNASGSAASPVYQQTSLESDGGLYASVRGRLGVAVDRSLLYITGGYFGADLGSHAHDRNGRFRFETESTGFQSGWTVGGGVEHALGGGWSVKAEYLYYDLGTETVVGTRGSGTTFDMDIDNTGSIARVGLNYKFGGRGEPLK